MSELSEVVLDTVTRLYPGTYHAALEDVCGAEKALEEVCLAAVKAVRDAERVVQEELSWMQYEGEV